MTQASTMVEYMTLNSTVAEYIFAGFEGELKELNGPFGKSGQENHGKPVYMKIGLNQGHKVMLYFWDERDGEQLHGWWLAPEVGGAHVWAMAPIGSSTPPQTGYRVPWHGLVSPKVTCMIYGKRVNPDGTEYGVAAAGPRKKVQVVREGVASQAAAAPDGPQTAMNAAFGQAFQAWQQTTGFAMPWQHKLIGGAIPAFTGNQIAPPSAVSEEPPVINTGQADCDKKKKEQEELSKNIPVELRRAEFERRTEAQQVRFFELRLHALVAQSKQLNEQAKRKMSAIQENPNFRTLLTIKAEGNLATEDLKTRSEELERVLVTIIRQLMMTRLATSNKILEGECIIKESKIPVSIWPEVRTKLQAYVKECEDLHQEATAWKQKKNDKEAVLWTKAADSLVEELDLVLERAEKDIELLKDASALITAKDLFEFLTTKELLGASQATEGVIGGATKSVQAASQAITEKIPLFKNASPGAFQKFRLLQLKIPSWNNEINRIQNLSNDADKKGRNIMLAEETQRFEEKQRERMKRVELWNQNMIDDAWAEVFVVESTVADAEANTTKESVSKARDAVVSLEKTIEDFIVKKEASNKMREVLSTTVGSKVHGLRSRLTECQKKISELDFDEDQKQLMSFAGRVIAFMEKYEKSDKELFESLTKGEELVTTTQIRAWCEVVVNTSKEEVNKAIERADWPRPTEKGALTAEEFPLLWSIYFEAIDGACLFTKTCGEESVKVPNGTLVMLCGVPSNHMLPVKAVYSDHPSYRGFLNAKLPGWGRVSPHYSCTHQTVLTSAFDMTTTDFQLVKRIKVGEKLRIIEPPKVCGEETEFGVLIRMKAQSMEDGKIGYCTISKPGTAAFLQPDGAFGKDTVMSTHHHSDVHCVEGEALEALREGDWVPCNLGRNPQNRENPHKVEVIWGDEKKGKVSLHNIRVPGSKTKVKLSKYNLADFIDTIIQKAMDDLSKVEIPGMLLRDGLIPSDQILAEGNQLEEKAKKAIQRLDAVHDYLKEKSWDCALTDRLTKDIGGVAAKHNDLMRRLNEFLETTGSILQDESGRVRHVAEKKEAGERHKLEMEVVDRGDKIVHVGVEILEGLENACEMAQALPKDATLAVLKEQLASIEDTEKRLQGYLNSELECAKAASATSAGAANLVLDLLLLQRKSKVENNEKLGEAEKLRKRIQASS